MERRVTGFSLVPFFSTHSQVIEGQNTKRAITQRVIALSKRLVELGGVEPPSENHSSLVLHA